VQSLRERRRRDLSGVGAELVDLLQVVLNRVRQAGAGGRAASLGFQDAPVWPQPKGLPVILVVAATERELAVVRGAETLCCGIGPVESAISTATALVERRPDAVLHVGIAGAAALEAGTVVIGSEARYCDLADPESALPRVERAFPSAELVEAARRALPDARVLPIATCGRVGGGAACEVEAMEGFGVLRAAELANVPAVEIRAISNRPEDSDRGLWRIEAALARLGEAVPPLLEELEPCVR